MIEDTPEPDPRIPVVFGDPAQARPGDVVLPPSGHADAAHAIGCACCRPRAPIATVLSRLYLDWVRANRPPPARVLVATEDRAGAVAALEADVVLRARFRLGCEAGRSPSESP